MFVDLNMIDTWFILIKNAAPFGLMFLITYSMFRTASADVFGGGEDGRGERTAHLCRDHASHGARVHRYDVRHVGDQLLERLLYAVYVHAFHQTLALGLQELSEEAATYSNYTELYACYGAAITRC